MSKEKEILHRFSLIVDRESDVRLNTKLKKLITSAKFPSNTADMEDILYWPDRRLNRDLIQMLRTNACIDKKRNVMFLGPIGSGKTFLANAPGINACRGAIRFSICACRISTQNMQKLKPKQLNWIL
ncbi:MAG: hypothetical protein E7202_00595 [Selenomonas ruminantium]|jgi:DNA replication protein DnaC|nr:hypothetical protein [Selenomonas ruminantium]